MRSAEERLTEVRTALEELIAGLRGAGSRHVAGVESIRAGADDDVPAEQLLRQLDREWSRVVGIPGGISDDYVPGDRAANDELQRRRVRVGRLLSAGSEWRADD